MFPGHDKTHCCGVYPDRSPYDPNFHDCCEMTALDQFLGLFVTKENLVKVNQCEDQGGKFIEPYHLIHNHAHDTVMGTDSLVLGKSLTRSQK
jgi:hypothetical protein